MKYFLIALQFLTILPIKIKNGIKKEDFGKSIAYFPLVGMLIGCILALFLITLDFLSPMVASGLILVISTILTGGIHLDGLADTCDGFYGGKSKAETLKIMRDSNIGAIGVIGVVSVMILKFAFFYSIPPDFLWKALIAMAVGGRYSQGMAACLSRYAREEGKAKSFVEYATRKELIICTLFAFIAFSLLMQIAGVIILILLTGVSLFFIRCVKRRIEGMTGDTIGAISEIAEVSTLLIVLVLIKIPCLS